MQVVQAPPVGVVIVVDQPILAKVISLWCRLSPNIEVAGICGDGDEVLAMVTRPRPDIVLLDLGLPVKNGFEVESELAGAFPEVRCLFMSAVCTELTLLCVERSRA